ncbi:MAG: ATP-binding cassette domain-containing protein [Verrucomicrobiota bacterium]
MLELKDVTLTAGSFQLADISFAIPTGTCGVLIGQTGCGKTTLLEGVCGLRRVAKGNITFQSRELTHLRPGERRIGFVPQDTALFTTMSVRDHLAFGPSLHRWDRPKIAQRVEELADALGIVSILDRKPAGLSGGEGKRVALGRALASRPDLLCLDESLTGLDTETHESILQLLLEIIQRERVTTLHITHNREEGNRLGNCFFELKNGLLSEIEHA